MKILLVDDDTAFRSRLKRSLEQHTLTVDEAGSVNDAKALILANDYQACLLDLRMPVENGLELLPHLRKHLPAAKAILFTGFGSAATVAQAFKGGAVDFLSKPASIKDILSALGVAPVQQEVAPTKASTKYPTLVEIEKEYLSKVLVDCEGNITKAAKALGLHRRSLQRKLERLDS